MAKKVLQRNAVFLCMFRLHFIYSSNNMANPTELMKNGVCILISLKARPPIIGPIIVPISDPIVNLPIREY